jgi:hypothetical protein
VWKTVRPISYFEKKGKCKNLVNLGLVSLCIIIYSNKSTKQMREIDASGWLIYLNEESATLISLRRIPIQKYIFIWSPATTIFEFL